MQGLNNLLGTVKAVSLLFLPPPLYFPQFVVFLGVVASPERGLV